MTNVPAKPNLCGLCRRECEPMAQKEREDEQHVDAMNSLDGLVGLWNTTPEQKKEYASQRQRIIAQHGAIYVELATLALTRTARNQEMPCPNLDALLTVAGIKKHL